MKQIVACFCMALAASAPAAEQVIPTPNALFVERSGGDLLCLALSNDPALMWKCHPVDRTVTFSCRKDDLAGGAVCFRWNDATDTQIMKSKGKVRF